MSDDNKDIPVPAKLEPAKPSKIEGPSTSYSLTFGPDGLVVKPEAAKKADDKKKMPRGSSVFRHA